MSYNYSSASSDSEEEEEDPLKSVTISVDQLCRKLKKINHRFTWEFVNENDDYSDTHDTSALSSAKK